MIDTEKQRILVVDDMQDSLQLISCILNNLKKNYDIKCVTSGEEALEVIPSYMPNIILLDIIMGGIDGFTTCQKIKQMAKPIKHIPIIFITGKNDSKYISQAFDLGAVDYISKPIFPKEVQSRVQVHLTMQSLVTKQRQLNEFLMEEQMIAKEVFDKMVCASCLSDLAHFKYWISSQSIFNGDMILAKFTPKRDKLYVMIGDFTGHGLPAAIGIIPAADAFYSMSGRNFPLTNIANEINRKLNENLPTGIFCAATIICFNKQAMTVEIINCGIPGVLLVVENNVITKIESANLPLAITNEKSFSPKVELIKVNKKNRMYLFTDGIAEIKNSQGEFYTTQRVHSIINKTSKHECFDQIIDNVNSFSKNKQEDDITMVEITF